MCRDVQVAPNLQFEKIEVIVTILLAVCKSDQGDKKHDHDRGPTAAIDLCGFTPK